MHYVWLFGIGTLTLVFILLIGWIAHDQDRERPYALIAAITFIMCLGVGVMSAFMDASAGHTTAHILGSAVVIGLFLSAICTPMALFIGHMIRLKPQQRRSLN